VRRALTTLPVYSEMRFALDALRNGHATPGRWN
jgi:hypothetical protein